jgi:hypothetical protein
VEEPIKETVDARLDVVRREKRAKIVMIDR